MANLATLQVKTIQAAVEAIDSDDPKDAELVLKLIRSILESGEKATKEAK
jgi:hypothetical protein